MEKKSQILSHCKDAEQKKFFASGLDQMTLAEQRQCQTHTGFFTQEEQAEFLGILSQLSGDQFQFLGGFLGAERQICCFLPDWQEEIEEMPLAVVEAVAKGEIGHRDVLGSLMGLGLSRRKIGDILISPDKKKCQLILLQETLPIVLSQWSGIGRFSVSLREIALTDLVPTQEVKEITSTVASLRLDSVVATGFSLARSKAVSLIGSGRVLVNHKECTKADRQIQEGDTLTCRGLGKCLVTEVKGQSRKGRIILTLSRYV